ncbi:MAG TPA: YibE/F family protein [Spirochaetota bacterium]|nr:YibE/F family protein [Spirochaetota bacterium]HPI88702.1 YibE/F family protein [Spirochaetota bacterium]HPR48776.1 YibE/F family protein [Spirochaetota bacterium]
MTATLNSARAQDDVDYYDQRIYTRAEIVNIEKKEVKRNQAIKLVETHIHLKILEGEFKGQIRTAIFGGESDLPYDMRYKIGDRVFVGISPVAEAGSTEYISLYDIDNTRGLVILGILLLIAIIGIGRLKGVASLAALLVTISLLFFVLIPLTLKGYPPLPLAVAICIFSTLLTLPIIAGINKKTASAILGASGGIILTSILAFISGKVMHLSGIITNDMLTVFYASDINIDLRGLVLSAMIIAALGALMDVCISIASSANEIFRANPAISEKEAFRSVLTIGTDILGSMVNTLVLAYVGSSLSLILWIYMRLEPGMPLGLVFNYNPVLSEIVKSIIGSVGMFICIPLTAFIAVKMLKTKNT